MRNDTARARLAGAAIGVGTLVSVTLGSFGPAAEAVTEPYPPTVNAVGDQRKSRFRISESRGPGVGVFLGG